MQEPEKIVSLSDPSEIDRDQHNRGDRFVLTIGNWAAWLFPILMVVITAQVFLRQAGNNQAWMDDLQWWLYGIACLIGIAYAVTTNSHVRVDIFFDNFPKRKQHRINVLALGWLFMPFALLCWDLTFHYVASSVRAWEGSDSPNGLHNLWFLKVLMNLSFVVIFVACWSAFVRFLSQLATPTLWRQMLWALPTTIFIVNLAVYYLFWWFTRLTNPELNVRAISRQPLFNEIEFGAQSMPITVLIALVFTTAMILAARALENR